MDRDGRVSGSHAIMPVREKNGVQIFQNLQKPQSKIVSIFQNTDFFRREKNIIIHSWSMAKGSNVESGHGRELLSVSGGIILYCAHCADMLSLLNAISEENLKKK